MISLDLCRGNTLQTKGLDVNARDFPRANDGNLLAEPIGARSCQFCADQKTGQACSRGWACRILEEVPGAQVE